MLELRAEAQQLRNNGNYMAAHLTYLQAAREAQEIGDLTNKMLLMAEALINGGKANIQSDRKLEILIDLRRQILEAPDAVPQNTNYSLEGYIQCTYFDFLADHLLEAILPPYRRFRSRGRSC
jgi:hypothetical protein